MLTDSIIRITYFKKSGKYYAEGAYVTHHKEMWKVFAEISEMLRKGIRPGLVDGWDNFYVHLDCLDHPMSYPALLPPEQYLPDDKLNDGSM